MCVAPRLTAGCVPILQYGDGKRDMASSWVGFDRLQ